MKLNPSVCTIASNNLKVKGVSIIIITYYRHGIKKNVVILINDCVQKKSYQLA